MPSTPRRKRSELRPFATAMLHLRGWLDIDQATMAARLGTSTRTLSDWENAYAMPPANQRIHFLYVLDTLDPDRTQLFAELFGITHHPAVQPLLAPEEPEAPAPVPEAPVVAAPPVAPVVVEAPPVVVEAPPVVAPPPPPPEPKRPTAEALRAALDRVVRDVADDVDVRASDLRAGVTAVLAALASGGCSFEEALGALALAKKSAVTPPLWTNEDEPAAAPTEPVA
jgi:hypothetical protein